MKSSFKKYKILYFVILITTFVKAQNNNTLWYESAANNWNEALPIGNGRIGGMLFGGIEYDKIQLNEETVWAGQPGNNVPKDYYKEVEAIRTLLFSGKYKEAQEMANSVFPRAAEEDNNYGMPYQTVGNLNLNFSNHQNTTNYKRTLDIGNAVSTVTYTNNGVDYQREYFVSFPDQVMVVHLTASKPKSLSFNLSMDSPQVEHSISYENGIITLAGTSGNVDNKEGKIKFTTLVAPKLDGGELIENEENIEIKNADEVTLLVSIGTNFKNYKDLSNSAEQSAKTHLEQSQSKSFATLKQAHIEDYQKLFNRVSLELGENTNDKIPTNKRLENFATAEDLSLVSLYFQFGRYLLISSSRPGGQPANLQGIWNHKLSPSWDSKYTVNINTEMNYWYQQKLLIFQSYINLYFQC
ncbi:glycoside hydrolase N-terminal domain-containing protein [Thalassobellus suaedae]|uniref:Glycoside hydrolase family 95 protein n=1 Tax=Thalassobellus suaedae TaxID=3074124 RepID=A0ABY9XT38_9FLAO|nr:glycoside hydrolase family 95 protein [Flavobacteriaceae bacterium HL-DH14]